jgi:hypothetical protein
VFCSACSSQLEKHVSRVRVTSDSTRTRSLNSPSGTEGLLSRFHVLCSRTRFRRYRGSRVPFACFALSDSFSAVPRASGAVFKFCEPRLIFGGTDGVGSRFHVLRVRTHFWRYLRRRVPFSCFAFPDSFSAVSRASGPVFKFCDPVLIFDGTRASGPIFIFCAPGLVFGGPEGVGSRFHILPARTHFRRYQGRRVPFSGFALLTRFLRYEGRRVLFSCFAHPVLFSADPRASSPVLMFCVPILIFDGAEGVGSRFHVFAAGHVFGGSEGFVSRFLVLRPRTRFRR